MEEKECADKKIEQPTLQEAFDHLEVMAERRNLELDKSYFDELENYSRHKVVEDLTSAQLRRVIEGLGEDAMSQKQLRRARRVGGLAIRSTIMDRCTKVFSVCDQAAEFYLSRRRER